MTKAAYTNLTGEAPPENRIPLSLNELLGFPGEQHISLKDVTDRIACWPDVTGCVLSQSSGLSLVGTVPDGLDKAAVVAFAPADVRGDQQIVLGGLRPGDGRPGHSDAGNQLPSFPQQGPLSDHHVAGCPRCPNAT